jgi:hypothetical protein
VSPTSAFTNLRIEAESLLIPLSGEVEDHGEEESEEGDEGESQEGAGEAALV